MVVGVTLSETMLRKTNVRQRGRPNLTVTDAVVRAPWKGW